MRALGDHILTITREVSPAPSFQPIEDETDLDALLQGNLSLD